jgi:hypothetical protein
MPCSLKTLVAAMAVSAALASAALADDAILKPAARRFAAATDETPDFQRHVVPLLGRFGCNGRACHGSFQGQGGFRLSLFGFDFAADHKSLTAASPRSREPRADRSQPEQSLLLRKPTSDDEHEGGMRFATDSWPYRLLERWIAAGARGTPSPERLLRLEVEPPQLTFAAEGQSRPLRVTARWSDGTAEDVTCLCRFQANDDSIASIDADGVVTVRGRGAAHVVVFYDNEVSAVAVETPISDLVGDKYPKLPEPTRIDELIGAKLRTLGIVPAEICTDAEFLRRASLDACGTLPTADEVERFLADTSPDKRLRKIDELLARPAYAAWWSNKLCDYTGNSPFGQSELGQKLSVQWYHWIYRRVLDDVPYDELVAGIVTAVGREDHEPYVEYSRSMTELAQAENLPRFAERRTMPHYWTRNALKTPEQKALAFAHSFLGVQLQCAECHKHPFDRWTQDDFREFAKLFERVKHGVPPDSAAEYRKIAAAIGANVKGNEGANVTPDLLASAGLSKPLPWRELFIETKNGPTVRLSALGEKLPPIAPTDDPRVRLMEWMRRPDNPYFARAWVNRVWANYFHVGLIDPPDDANPANPPSNAELLDYLARDFAENGFGMRRLHRTIMSSAAYQRSSRPNETNAGDRRHYARFVPRRLPAEVVYDAVTQAAASDERAEVVRTDLERRAIGHLSTLMAGTYAMNVFGKPERKTNCDCERDANVTLLQAIFMQNDPLVRQRLDESDWLTEAAAKLESAADAGAERNRVVRSAYLRTVGRPPTDDDLARIEKHFTEAASPAEALHDVLWALLNSKEFLLNH